MIRDDGDIAHVNDQREMEITMDTIRLGTKESPSAEDDGKPIMQLHACFYKTGPRRMTLKYVFSPYIVIRSDFNVRHIPLE